MYAVVACPRCRRSRVVEQGRKTAACASCDRPLALADLRSYYQGASLEEAQQAAGLLNAKLAGREAEFVRALLPQEAPSARHDDPWEAAAAAARRATGETERVDAVARALSAGLGDFSEDDLRRALDLAGLRGARAGAHVARMLGASVLFEPRAGRYRAL